MLIWIFCKEWCWYHLLVYSINSDDCNILQNDHNKQGQSSWVVIKHCHKIISRALHKDQANKKCYQAADENVWDTQLPLLGSSWIKLIFLFFFWVFFFPFGVGRNFQINPAVSMALCGSKVFGWSLGEQESDEGWEAGGGLACSCSAGFVFYLGFLLLLVKHKLEMDNLDKWWEILLWVLQERTQDTWKASMMQAFTSYGEICFKIEMSLFLNNSKNPLN